MAKARTVETARPRRRLWHRAVRVQGPQHFRGGTQFRGLPPPPIHPMALVRLTGSGLVRDSALIVALSVGGAMLGLFLPAATALLFGEVIPAADRGQAFFVLLGMFAAACGVSAFEFGRSLVLLRLMLRFDRAVHLAVFDRLLRARPRLFGHIGAADAATRILDIALIHRVLGPIVGTTILSLGFAVANLAFMVWISPMLTVVGVILVVMIAGLTRLCIRRQIAHELAAAEMDARIAEFATQVQRRLETIRAADAEAGVMGRWQHLFDRLQRDNVGAQRAANLGAALNAAFALLAPAMLFVAVALVPDSPSTASFLAFYAAFGQLLFAVLGLSTAAASASRLVAPYRRLQPLIDAREERTEDAIQPADAFAGLTVADVTFRYADDAPPALDGVSLQVGPGEIVVLTGPSGSGKSTLVKLLLRLEAEQHGRIKVGDQPIGGLDPVAWRRRIGAVLQDSPIFPGTVASNIAGLGGAADVDVREAAAIVGLLGGASELPSGLDTPIRRTAALPGSLRQQIILARALLRRPQLLLLDEATNVMDTDLQRRVLANIRSLEIACLSITHRLTGMAMSDRIYMLEQGRVVDQGDFGELLFGTGPFARAFGGGSDAA